MQILFLFIPSLIASILSTSLLAKKIVFQELNPAVTTVSLVTAGRGPSIHMLGGHSLFRVENKPMGIDVMVNWGLFDFDDPDFLFNYFKGILNYKSGLASTAGTIHFYKEIEHRSLWQNKMNLTDKQKQRFFEKLDWWLLPKNDTYPYDLWFQNCATIMRDVMEYTLGEGFKQQYLRPTGKTLRVIGTPYVLNYPVFAFLAPLLTNSLIDAPITLWEQFHLPLEAQKLLDLSPAFGDNGQMETKLKLLSVPEILVSGTSFDLIDYNFSIVIPLFFFLLILLGLFLKNHRLLGLTICIYGIFSSFFAIFMLVMWAFTAHRVTYHNANLWFYWPIDLWFVVIGIAMLATGKLHQLQKQRKVAKIIILGHLFAIVFGSLGSFLGFIEQDITISLFYFIPIQFMIFSMINFLSRLKN